MRRHTIIAALATTAVVTCHRSPLPGEDDGGAGSGDGPPVGDVGGPGDGSMGPGDTAAPPADSATGDLAAGDALTGDLLNGDLFFNPPPLRSDGMPNFNLPDGATTIEMEVVTGEIATCRYDSMPATPYGAMAFTFGSTGGFFHVQTLTGLADGMSYTYYVRCQDPLGAANNDDYTISFDVAVTPPVLPVYRSVGANNTLALAVGAVNGLQIRGSLAQFENPLLPRVGVGDILTYDSAGTGGGTDARAMITQRVTEWLFQVRDTDGSPAQETVGTINTWQLHRAYTSLTNAAQKVENLGIPMAERDFDPMGTSNLPIDGQSWHFACYADDEDVGNASFASWTTSPQYFLRVYTPTEPNEVGRSQRHNGSWDTSAYRLRLGTAGSAAVSFGGTQVTHIEGLQVDVDSGGITQYGVLLNPVSASTLHSVSSTIIRGNGGGTSSIHAGIYILNGNNAAQIQLYNNLIYGFTGAAAQQVGLVINQGAVAFHNNTVADTVLGIGNAGGVIVARNNLFINVPSPATGTFLSLTDYNATDAAAMGYTVGGGGMNDRLNQAFVIAGAPDYHLDAADTGALDQGGIISDLGFTTDIDGEIRDSAYDIGADEFAP